MTSDPSVVVFDVNETLSDLSPLGDRFEEVGLPVGLAATWFAALLRDGFALTCLGEARSFAEIGEQVLRDLMDGRPLRLDPNSAVQHIMSAFNGLGTHPDVEPGVVDLRRAGLRLVTLSNGSVSVGEGLLRRAGVAQYFERLMSVSDAGIWKPAPGAYRYAAEQCGCDPSSMVMVAVHPWDIHGAARAGMRTAWVNRSGGAYPSHFEAPTWSVAGIDGIAAVLAGR